MRLVRKLMWPAAAAIAALACAAPAQATDTVQVVNEDTTATCGALAGGGGCQVHWVGTFELRIDLGFLGEVHEATCNLEMESRMDGTGGMAVDALEHDTGPDTYCNSVMTECKLPWSGKGEEDSAVGILSFSLALCIDPAASSSNCEGNLAFFVVEQASEHYDTQFINGAVGVCELDVDLEVEHVGAGNVHVHINHP